MYFVNDLYNDTCAKAGSMTDIAYWWHRKVGRDFFQLNVTGKDTHTAMEKDGSWLHIQENGRSYVIPTYKKVIYLRRYQVLDEDGRSVDIRTWPKSVWEWTPTYPPCYWPCGFKSNYHRISGPSMGRGTYRASMNVLDESELLDEALPLPIRDCSDVRFPFNGTDDVWSYYDGHHCHWRSKSWKDQTKARKQWAKHKRKGENREDKWARHDRELAMLLAGDSDNSSEEAA